MLTANKAEIIQLLDIIMDDPRESPDLSAVSTIIAGSSQPIGLSCALVQLLWMSAERPDLFDASVIELYGS